MPRLTPTLRLTVLALAAGLAVAATGRAQTYADLVNDYAITGLPLTATGTGEWNFYASTTQDPTAGTLTPLSYQGVGNAGNMGYGLLGGSFAVPAVAAQPIFPDGADPAGSYLAWHPGDSAAPRPYTVISWTAGAGESGPVEIAGAFSRVNEPNGMVNFFIYVNGVQEYSQSSIHQGDSFNFDFTAAIASGQTVSLVLDSAGSYSGDESLIRATISAGAIPEPATYAALAGLGALGLVLVRRRLTA